MIHISLFSGIGGFDLASEWMGWKNYVSCDINEFGNRVREYYWPEAYHHRDIKTLTYETINAELSRRYGNDWRNQDIILTGGFPCQPFSVAGKQLGTEDDRHLWPEMLRVIREVGPRWIVGENVRGLVNWSGGLVFDQVQADLEAEGYEVIPFILPACAVDAPHRRDRIWFVAYRSNAGDEGVREPEISANKLQSTSDTGNDGLFGTEERQGLGERDDRGAARQDEAGKFEGRTKAGPFIASDSESGRYRGGLCERCATGEWQFFQNEPRGGSMGCKVEGCMRVGTTANTENAGQQARPTGQRKDQFRGGNEPVGARQWEGFPTQSPVCDGDDGLSARLDGITFSKWRQESIKAGGNAVVPQVVYQIFKAIEYHDHLRN